VQHKEKLVLLFKFPWMLCYQLLSAGARAEEPNINNCPTQT